MLIKNVFIPPCVILRGMFFSDDLVSSPPDRQAQSSSVGKYFVNNYMATSTRPLTKLLEEPTCIKWEGILQRILHFSSSEFCHRDVPIKVSSDDVLSSINSLNFSILDRGI